MRDAKEPMFNNQITRNKYIWFALLFCFAVIFTMYLIPDLRSIFHMQLLPIRVWGLIILASVLPSVIIQTIKISKKDF